MRKGCRTSKTEKACRHYNHSLQRCTLGKVKATCSMVSLPKPGTKAAQQAQEVKDFYDSCPFGYG